MTLAQSASGQPLNCRLSLNGERLILTGYSPELLAFYHELPDARFDRASNSWSCLRTPVAVWRVVSRMTEYLPPDALADEAMDFGVRRLRAERIRNGRGQCGLAELPTKTNAWRHQKAAFAFSREIIGE